MMGNMGMGRGNAGVGNNMGMMMGASTTANSAKK
jgi:hypothetical protein